MGEKWLQKHQKWTATYITPRLSWYEQLQLDLDLLESFVGLKKLITCFRDSLRDKSQIQKSIYEIHGAAFLGAAATRLDLHVPRGDNSRRNFDIQVEIEGHALSADSKTRKDEFPFNIPKKRDTEISSHAGVRATIDPHDAIDLGLNVKHPIDLNYIEVPESTVIRQLLLEGLAQLPQLGCNVVLFGHIEGQRRSLEDALFGAEFVGIRKDPKARKIYGELVRPPTGAFGRGPEGEPFRALSGVLWLRLFKSFDAPLFRSYKFYPNPHANSCIPDSVQQIIENLAKEWERLPQG